MSRSLARGALLGVAIERSPRSARLVAPAAIVLLAALAALASAVLLREPVERS